MRGSYLLVPAAGIATWVFAYLARWLGPRFGMMDDPDEHLKMHERPISYLGGVAVLAGIVVGFLLRGFVVVLPFGATLPRWGATLAAIGVFFIGFWDDRRGLRPTLRFALEIVLGVMVAAVLPAAALPGPILAFIGAVVLFVGSLNCVNMLDGMDGLAASCVAISAAGLAVIGWEGQAMVAVLVTLGAALGFLMHNWPPARLFLGDSGAYVLGAALAVAILTEARTPAGLAGGVTCLGVFGMDLCLTVLRRLQRGTSLMQGDRGHFYDQLVKRGLTPRMTLYLCMAAQVYFVIAGIGIAAMSSEILVGVIFLLLWGTVAGGLRVGGFVQDPA